MITEIEAGYEQKFVRNTRTQKNRPRSRSFVRLVAVRVV